MKKILAVLLCVFSLATAARADEIDDVKSWAQEMINSTVTEIFQKDKAHDEQVVSFRRALADNFDFAYIGKFVLGVYARGASAGQMKRFVGSFSELNVQSYASKFSAYDYQKIYVTDARASKKAVEFFVDTKALADDPAKKDTVISWRLARADGAYKVIDVVIEGVSMAMSYRNEYASILKAAADEGGEPIDALIDKIDAKVDELKAGKD
jgi:phospholipid transport system substrate-binding protein